MSTRLASERASRAIARLRNLPEVPQVTKDELVQLVAAEKRKPKAAEHGRQIFVYTHLQKNNVVYSLTRSLRNNASLRQLPYNGKKTVPSALRKDLWHPFALISFPPGRGSVGLSAFQKLREYRKRHELEWGDEIRLDSEGKVETRKNRGRKIQNQKANTVADIATVLGKLNLAAAIEGEETAKGEGKIGLIGEGTGEKVEVLWETLTDAEYAETWTENVEHGRLETQMKTRDPEKIWGTARVILEGEAEEIKEEARKEEQKATNIAKAEEQIRVAREMKEKRAEEVALKQQAYWEEHERLRQAYHAKTPEEKALDQEQSRLRREQAPGTVAKETPKKGLTLEDYKARKAEEIELKQKAYWEEHERLRLEYHAKKAAEKNTL